MAKVFEKFGRDLGCDIDTGNEEKKRISLFSPKDFKKKSIMEGSNPTKDPFSGIDTV